MKFFYKVYILNNGTLKIVCFNVISFYFFHFSIIISFYNSTKYNISQITITIIKLYNNTENKNILFYFILYIFCMHIFL